MSHDDPRYYPRGNAVRYEAYVAKLARFVARLLETGEHVLLFSSQNPADANVAADLRQLLAEQGLDDHPALESAIEGTASVDDLLRVISRCDYVVAGRFHCVLAPTALGIPTIGLAYHEKTCELLRDVGRPERCFDIDHFNVSDLVAAFLRLRAEDGVDERAALRGAAEHQRSAVEKQFDELFEKR
jgi:polysaccharide pyruvyl transferase WcaK-like protein